MALRGCDLSANERDAPVLPRRWPIDLGVAGRLLAHPATPIVLLVALSVGFALGLIYVASRGLDHVAVSRSEALVNSLLDTETRDIGKEALDYAYWDEAYARLTGQPDLEWADLNIGAYAHEYLGISASFVVSAEGGATLAFVDGETVPSHGVLARAEGLERLVAEARASDPADPAPRAGLVAFDGRPHFAGAAALTPDTRILADDEAARRPVLVYLRRLDGAVLQRWSTDFSLDGIHLVAPGEPVGPATRALHGPDGASLGRLSWNVDLPGQRLIRETLLPIAVIFAMVAGLGVVILRRMNETARRLRHSLALLARRNKELSASEQRLRGAIDEAQLANRSKTEFLANVSHELRTPLNAIIGFSEVIRDELVGPVGNPTYREYAGDIHESGRHLLQLIGDILDLSKMEAGHMALNEETVDLADVCASVVRIVHERAHAAGVTIDVALARDLPPVRADQRAMRQILINLLSNAIKFTPPGGSIRIHGGPSEEGGLRLAVSDTGIGIAESDIPLALAPFGQVDGARFRDVEGTGLGLPLSVALAEGHGGRIEIHSRLGEGTEVALILPAERVARAAGAGAPNHRGALADPAA